MWSGSQQFDEEVVDGLFPAEGHEERVRGHLHEPGGGRGGSGLRSSDSGSCGGGSAASSFNGRLRRATEGSGVVLPRCSSQSGVAGGSGGAGGLIGHTLQTMSSIKHHHNLVLNTEHSAPDLLGSLSSSDPSSPGSPMSPSGPPGPGVGTFQQPHQVVEAARAEAALGMARRQRFTRRCSSLNPRSSLTSNLGSSFSPLKPLGAAPPSPTEATCEGSTSSTSPVGDSNSATIALRRASVAVYAEAILEAGGSLVGSRAPKFDTNVRARGPRRYSECGGTLTRVRSTHDLSTGAGSPAAAPPRGGQHQRTALAGVMGLPMPQLQLELQQQQEEQAREARRRMMLERWSSLGTLRGEAGGLALTREERDSAAAAAAFGPATATITAAGPLRYQSNPGVTVSAQDVVSWADAGYREGTRDRGEAVEAAPTTGAAAHTFQAAPPQVPRPATPADVVRDVLMDALSAQQQQPQQPGLSSMAQEMRVKAMRAAARRA